MITLHVLMRINSKKCHSHSYGYRFSRLQLSKSYFGVRQKNLLSFETSFCGSKREYLIRRSGTDRQWYSEGRRV